MGTISAVVLAVLFVARVRSLSLSWTPVRLVRPYDAVRTLDEGGSPERTLLLPTQGGNNLRRYLQVDPDFAASGNEVYREDGANGTSIRKEANGVGSYVLTSRQGEERGDETDGNSLHATGPERDNTRQMEERGHETQDNMRLMAITEDRGHKRKHEKQENTRQMEERGREIKHALHDNTRQMNILDITDEGERKHDAATARDENTRLSEMTDDRDRKRETVTARENAGETTEEERKQEAVEKMREMMEMMGETEDSMRKMEIMEIMAERDRKHETQDTVRLIEMTEGRGNEGGQDKEMMEEREHKQETEGNMRKMEMMEMMEERERKHETEGNMRQMDMMEGRARDNIRQVEILEEREHQHETEGNMRKMEMMEMMEERERKHETEGNMRQMDMMEGRARDNIRQVEIVEEKDAANGGDVQTFSVKFDNGTVWRFRRMRRRKAESKSSLAVAPPPPPLPPPLPPPQRQRRPQPPPQLDNGVFDAGKAHIKSKLAKFLNLFTVIQFSNDACMTADGLKGTCYHHLECRSQGGVASGPCAQGYGSCCVFQSTCGDTTMQNCTYFVDPGVTSNIKECSLDIVKSHPDVTQLRLDFAQFELVGPANGSCIDDQFIVSGQNRNSIIPAICGINTGQHMYVDVTTTVSPVRLSVITQMRNLDRHYRIKVTQVIKGSPLEAPRNCLQYYWGPTGTIESFNYQPRVVNKIVTPAGYMNNLNYAICVRKEDGYCSITFNNVEPFQLVNVDENGVSLISPRQAGVEIFDCPDDYIVLNGLRMCGERLNDASGDVDYTRDAPVTETTNGPFVIPVRTNAAYNGRGFRVGFTQGPCT